jgi:hypothetical protein
MKLKYHRLRPGGVQKELLVDVVMKLKYHRLKPGGVQKELLVDVVMKLKYHRLKPGGVNSEPINQFHLPRFVLNIDARQK